MNTKLALGAATAALAIGVGFSEPASALTFSVNADIFDAVDFNDIGDITGSFQFTGGTYDPNSISLTSSLTGTVYNTLISGDGFSALFGSASVNRLQLTFASDLGRASFGDTIALVGGSTFESNEAFPVTIPFSSQTISAAVPVGGSATAIPTPALLPGLIGLGVAALRRKDEESAEENA